MTQGLHLGMELNGEKSSNRMSLLLLEESDQMAFLAEFFLSGGFRLVQIPVDFDEFFRAVGSFIPTQ